MFRTGWPLRRNAGFSRQHLTDISPIARATVRIWFFPPKYSEWFEKQETVSPKIYQVFDRQGGNRRRCSQLNAIAKSSQRIDSRKRPASRDSRTHLTAKFSRA